MPHIAEVYAKNLGVNVGQAKLNEHFYPNTKENYIICNFKDAQNTCNQYDYWPLVFNMVNDTLLKHNVTTLNIDDEDGISLKQKNFLIKNAKLYLGMSNHYAKVAAIYDVPSICMVGNTYANVCKPSEEAIMLSPDFSEIKPTFQSTENEKRINEIKPEIIAKSILESLGLEEELNFKTIFTGKTFQNATIEIVPNFFGISPELENQAIIIRGDLHYNINAILQWANANNNMIIIDKPLPLDSLHILKNKTKRLVFYIDSIEEDLNTFFKNLKKLKIDVVILTKDKDSLSELRLKYFDFDVHLEECRDVSKLVNENTKFLSNKLFITDGKTYNSRFSANRLDNSDKFILNDISKLELESLYLYE